MSAETNQSSNHLAAFQAYRALVSELAQGAEVDSDHFDQTLREAGRTETDLHRDIELLTNGRIGPTHPINISVTVF